MTTPQLAQFIFEEMHKQSSYNYQRVRSGLHDVVLDGVYDLETLAQKILAKLKSPLPRTLKGREVKA